MYTIITDSCCDLNPEVAAGIKQFEILPLSYTMAGVTSRESLVGEAAKAYYDRLRAGENCTTSQINPEEFYQAYRAHIEKGEQLLCIHFSSALSGTYSSACIAREMILDEYPDAVIEVVDSLAASAGQGMMVCDAARNRENGVGLCENAKWLTENRLNYAMWFTVDDLHFLKRGGRCTPSAAFFGSMLSIKPVLHVSDEGKLIARAKVRGRKQALHAVAQKVGELEGAADQTIFISHGDCESDALLVKQYLIDEYGCDPEKIVLSYVGPVIGSHAGPGVVALFFRGKGRG